MVYGFTARASAVDRVFRALASEPRREILRMAAHERRTVGELAEHFEMSLAAVSKHVRVLEEARLLSYEHEGRLHWCRLNPDALDAARATIDDLRSYWNKRLDALERVLRDRSGAGHSRKKRR